MLHSNNRIRSGDQSADYIWLPIPFEDADLNRQDPEAKQDWENGLLEFVEKAWRSLHSKKYNSAAYKAAVNETYRGEIVAYAAPVKYIHFLASRNPLPG